MRKHISVAFSFGVLVVRLVLVVFQSECHQIFLVAVEFISWQWNRGGVFLVARMTKFERNFAVCAAVGGENFRQIKRSDALCVLVGPET